MSRGLKRALFRLLTFLLAWTLLQLFPEAVPTHQEKKPEASWFHGGG